MRAMMKPCKTNPELLELLDASKKAYEAMTRENKHAMREAQKRSWVIGEMLIENPNMTREYVESIYESIRLGDME